MNCMYTYKQIHVYLISRVRVILCTRAGWNPHWSTVSLRYRDTAYTVARRWRGKCFRPADLTLKIFTISALPFPLLSYSSILCSYLPSPYLHLPSLTFTYLPFSSLPTFLLFSVLPPSNLLILILPFAALICSSLSYLHLSFPCFLIPSSVLYCFVVSCIFPSFLHHPFILSSWFPLHRSFSVNSFLFLLVTPT